MAINTTAAYQEALSLALEDRSKGLSDLVSNANVVFAEMHSRGMWTTFSGPNIRESLIYNETGSYVRYTDYDPLNPVPAELVNDAVFTPRQGAVAVSLSNREILQNSGSNMLHNVFKVHIQAAERELEDRLTEDMHSAGSETNQIGGLQKAIPTTPTNSYGGIDRNLNAIWKTTTYDANSITVAGTAITAVSSTTIKPLYNHVMLNRSRGRKGPSFILASAEHYITYQAATETIQRITDETRASKFGFTALKYYGSNLSVDVVAEAGIGSAMPSNVSYFIDADSMRFRYHPERNLTPIGKAMMPINQDAIVQYLGFFGEITMDNPLHNVKLYDSSP